MYGYPLILLPDVCELPVKRQRNGSRAARARASGKLKIAIPAANLVRRGCPAPAASIGWAVGAGARRDVDRCIPAVRALVSGEERLVPTTASRLILHLSRLKIAVPAASLVRRGCPAPAASSGWAVGAEEARHDVDRCLLAAPGARSSRILFHLSRLMVAVPAANLVTCGCRAGQRLGSGYGWALERAVATSTAAFLLRRARARGRGAACADLLPDTGPPPARPRAAAAPPSRGRGGRALHTVCRTQRRNRRLRRRAVPEPLDAPSLAQREASVAPRTPARPPSAPGPRARLAPPRESHLPRFGIGGGGGSSDAYLLWRQFLCAARRAWGSARARTTTHHRSPVDRAPARAGARPAPWIPPLQKM